MIPDPYDAWDPCPVDIDTGQAVLTLLCDDPPEDLPEGRPVAGFARPLPNG